MSRTSALPTVPVIRGTCCASRVTGAGLRGQPEREKQNAAVAARKMGFDRVARVHDAR